MRSMQKLGIIVALLALLSGTSTFAVWSTNSWTTDGSGYSGDYTNAAHFAPAVPGATDQVWFTNAQGAAYTVTFQQSTTNGLLRVGTDKVSFDMNGKLWVLKTDATAPGTWVAGYNADSSKAIAGGAGENATVSFSSSSAGTNSVVIDPDQSYFATWIGNATGSATLNINTNLGYGVRVWFPTDAHYFGLNNATVNVAGPGAELRADSYGGSIASTWNVTDGGKVIARGGQFGHDGFYGGGMNTVNVSRAGVLQTSSGSMVYFNPGGVYNITDGGIWNGGDVNMAFLTVYPNHGVINYDANLLITDTNTVVTLKSLRVGDNYDGVNYRANASVRVLNAAVLAVTNNLTINDGSAGSIYTNKLVLNNATIRLGGGATAGVLTNRGYMKAMGTITGMGSSPALVYVGSAGAGTGATFEVGGSIGTLTLNNANLELAAGSQTLFEFSDTALDQIIINGGGASVLGSNVFSLAAGSAPLAPGYKWGLGVYDFIVGTNVTWTPQYDNLTNILTAAGLVQGLDFRFGLADLGGGLQALRLEFVPEPSTVLLLVGGGLLLWRARRRT